MDEQDRIPLGYCQCGCGRETRRAPQTHRGKGWVKDRPLKYALGHAARRTPHDYEVADRGHDTPCWTWCRYIDRYGYGRSTNPAGPGLALAHVVYWERVHGSVPDGRELDHLCRQPDCVNPDHLEPVTHADNVRRGRSTKLTLEQVREIRASDEDSRLLAARFGISRNYVYNIRLGLSWRNE